MAAASSYELNLLEINQLEDRVGQRGLVIAAVAGAIGLGLFLASRAASAASSRRNGLPPPDDGLPPLPPPPTGPGGVPGGGVPRRPQSPDEVGLNDLFISTDCQQVVEGENWLLGPARDVMMSWIQSGWVDLQRFHAWRVIREVLRDPRWNVPFCIEQFPWLDLYVENTILPDEQTEAECVAVGGQWMDQQVCVESGSVQQFNLALSQFQAQFPQYWGLIARLNSLYLDEREDFAQQQGFPVLAVTTPILGGYANLPRG